MAPADTVTAVAVNIRKDAIYRVSPRSDASLLARIGNP
jgi:hypothetical protein